MSKRFIPFLRKAFPLLTASMLVSMFLLPSLAIAKDRDEKQGFYQQQNLVSNIAGMAAVTDSITQCHQSLGGIR